MSNLYITWRDWSDVIMLYTLAISIGIVMIWVFRARPLPPAKPDVIMARVRERWNQVGASRVDIKQELYLLKQDMNDWLYWLRRSHS